MPSIGQATPSQDSRTIVLRGGRVLTPGGWAESEVWIRNGMIQEAPRLEDGRGNLYEGTSAPPLDLNVEGRCVVPGFIDPHVHGAMGADFATADEAGIHRILTYLARVGVTGCLATLRSDTPDRLVAAVERLGSYKPRPGEAALLGIHLEGPYLSPEEAGAHESSKLRLPDRMEFQVLLERAQDKLRMITLAPELDGALELIETAGAAGVRVALGHSHCTFEQAQMAVERGATQVTHLFNGMRPWHHRQPGLAGAALTNDRLAVHVIADGVHIHPAAVQLAWWATRGGRRRTMPRLALMSDGAEAMGLGDGLYTRPDGQQVRVQDGRAVLVRNGAIAGGTQSLHHAVRNLRRWGLPDMEIFEASSTVIARELGLNKGRILPGGDADVVVMDDDWNVSLTIVGGQLVFAGEAL